MLDQIKFYYSVAENQENLFTYSHRKYRCIVKYNGKTITRFYQCNAKQQPTKEDFLYSLLMDSNSYECSDNYYDFCKEFGYEPYNEEYTGHNKEAYRAFKACERTNKRLYEVFTNEELEELDTIFQDY